MLKNIKTKEYENEIKNNEFVVVDFFASWCGPCRMLSQELEELKDELYIIKINTDEERRLAISEGIKVVPTIKFFKNGEYLDEMVGYYTKDEILTKIKEINK